MNGYTWQTTKYTEKIHTHEVFYLAKKIFFWQILSISHPCAMLRSQLGDVSFLVNQGDKTAALLQWCINSGNPLWIAIISINQQWFSFFDLFLCICCFSASPKDQCIWDAHMRRCTGEIIIAIKQKVIFLVYDFFVIPRHVIIRGRHEGIIKAASSEWEAQKRPPKVELNSKNH